MQNRRIEWTFRIKQEFKNSANGFFITLTYSDENLLYGSTDQPMLYKKEFQDFMKRLRFEQSLKTEVKIRYYAVGEYGTKTKRPHYHALIFNIHEDLLDKITEIWGGGHTHIAEVNDATIHYVTKYHVNRQWDKHPDQNEFTLMSTKPGIGFDYIKKVADWHKNNKYNYAINNGYKQKLPRYFKDRIFDEEHKFWLQYDSEILQQKAEIETIELLRKRGVENPEQYIIDSALQKARRYKHKNNNEKDLF